MQGTAVISSSGMQGTSLMSSSGMLGTAIISSALQGTAIIVVVCKELL
jgi:hypothetical protein